MVRRLVVAVFVLAGAMLHASPARADQDPVYIPKDGTVALRMTGGTTGLPFVVVDIRQDFTWRGVGLAVLPGGPGDMGCTAAGSSWGWAGVETGSVTVICNGIGTYSSTSFQCPFTFFRIGASLTMAGDCTMFTPTRRIPLSGEGELAWVPDQTQNAVRTYSLVGSISFVDTTMGN